ncbi:circadian clock KaiB family protein [Pannus brasiliensis CCIBt3594]|uniref:Circadian clock KaiB family protein n=1 Tax=Pannus brasiliensis CCIBt3594 TaxID=1427578 RepID=A0AAW9QXF6_9CHRO
MTVSVALPEIFKGIALFTPGGDLVYCIDPTKQTHWHLHLCASLQDILGLPEPPHFLVPGCTATIDRWRDPRSDRVRTSAEVYPLARRYQPLLNAIFGTDDRDWHTVPWSESVCNPSLLETYRPRFPQLWESHDLILRYENSSSGRETAGAPEPKTTETPRGYVLRLFVSGNNATTKHTLQSIHRLLERELHHPYTLKVIDISKHPEQAESNHVSAIPTLVRVWPQPVKRIVGEFEDLSRVLQLIATG